MGYMSIADVRSEYLSRY